MLACAASSTTKIKIKTLAVKTWPSIWWPPLWQLHVIPDDDHFEDCGTVITWCMTLIYDTTIKTRHTQAIDKKMQ
jgi:hypothetical protein